MPFTPRSYIGLSPTLRKRGELDTPSRFEAVTVNTGSARPA
jgi:hypothetical protein